MDGIRLFVLIVCAFAFTACVIGGLLIVFERWEPRNSHTKKWLVTGVLGAAVAAVMPQGGNLFASSSISADDTAETETEEPIAPNADADTTNVAATETPTTAPSPPPAPTPTLTPSPTAPTDMSPASTELTQTFACTMPHPTGYLDWAKGKLGPRPNFTCAWRTPYPTCIEDLAGRGFGETTGQEAANCGERVAEFRRQTIASLLAAKGPYGTNVDSVARQFRIARTPQESERREYLNAEILRLNGDEWDRFNEVADQSEADMDRCYSSQVCRSVAED